MSRSSFFRRWLDNLFTRHSKREDKVRSIRTRIAISKMHSRPRLEQLEDRLAPAATLSIADAGALEPAPGGTASIVFTVTRTGDLTVPLTVGYTTVAGTAQPTTDFRPITGTTAFAAGSATATIAIPIFGNGVYNNPSLTFSVKLTDFGPAYELSSGDSVFSVAVGDINGDGKPDLVITNYHKNSVSVLLNTTAPEASVPTFATKETFATGANPNAVVVTDINGDGKPDVIVYNFGDKTFSVLLNKTSPGAALATFATQQVLAAPVNNVTSMVAVDMNGDGKPDLVIGSIRGYSLSVLLNTTPLGAPTVSFAAPVIFEYAVKVADINGDGKPDLIFNEFSTIGVRMNTTAQGAATPSFGPETLIPTDIVVFGISMGDFNSDGKPDLVLGNAVPSGRAVAVLLNTTKTGAATATFAPPEKFALGFPSLFPEVADVNGDGKPDLVVPSPNGVGALLDTTATRATTAQFTGPLTLTNNVVLIDSYRASLNLADLNGDGRPDLIMPELDLGTVSILLNEAEAATGTIIETDAVPPIVSFAGPSETLTENASTFTIPVNLSPASKVDTTIPFTLGGSAVAGQDYTVTGNSITIPAGQTTGATTGTLINDYAVDAPQTLTFTLGTPTNATLGATTTNTMLIAETPPRATITDKSGYASLTEPAPGTTVPYYFTIALDDVPTKPVTIYYQTRDGSATAGDDYRGVHNYRVTFPAFSHGASANSPPSQDIAITINGDALGAAGPGTFSVVLTSAFNATIDPGGKTALGTILRAEPQAGTKVSIADFSAAGPSAGSMVFDVPITLDGPAAWPLTVYYTTTDGTAQAGVDYVGQNYGHVTIGAGDTSADIPITILADAVRHASRTFTITLYYWLDDVIVSTAATVTIE